MNKDLDIKSIAGIVTRYKNIILNIILVLAAVFISLRIYANQQKNMGLLDKKKVDELNKNKMAGEISQSEKKIIAYRDYLNKKDVNSVIGTIGELAVSSSIKLVSVRPEKEQPLQVYIKQPFTLSLAVPDYHTLGKFIAKLESHPDIYIVNSISVMPNDNALVKAGGVNTTLGIYTLFLKEIKEK